MSYSSAAMLIESLDERILKRQYKMLVKETGSNAEFSEFVSMANKHPKSTLHLYYTDDDVCWGDGDVERYRTSCSCNILTLDTKNIMGGKLL